MHELTRQGLVWFTDGSETEKNVGATLGDRVADSKWTANLTLMPPFSRLSLGPSRSVPKLCWSETAGENLW